jgi:hypothetical protein
VIRGKDELFITKKFQKFKIQMSGKSFQLWGAPCAVCHYLTVPADLVNSFHYRAVHRNERWCLCAFSVSIASSW